MKRLFKIESPKNDLKPFLKLFNRYKPLKKLIKKNSIIFDVGCNVGDTIAEFQHIFKCKKIYGFEPQIDCVEKLKARFKNKKNIEIYNYALDHKIHKKDFYFHKYGDVYSGFYKINLKSKDHIDLKNRKRLKSNLIKYQKNINKKIVLNTLTLDHFIKKKQIKRINLLKLDTQGSEHRILQGAKKNLKNIDVIITEIQFWDYYSQKNSFYNIEKIIRKHFELYDISYVAKNPENFRTDYIDVIYVNKNLK
tara:strand:+ start:2494 stop:3243 length:750 start_codon:yes stop_codon:yes gene_type:complete